MFYSLNVFLFKYLENITLEMIFKKLYLLDKMKYFTNSAYEKDAT